MIRAECLYCKSDMGPRPGTPFVSGGVLMDKTHDVCEKCKPMVELQIKEVKAGKEVLVGSVEEQQALQPANSTVENNRELLERFCGPLIREDQPETTIEELQVLFVRASNITWPDIKNECRKQFCKNEWHRHPKFTSKDGKALIKGHYNVESTKELRKPQVNFFYEEFGKVLAGRAYLVRDEKGLPFVVTSSDVNVK